MLSLSDRRYKSFKIDDVFKVSGTVTTHPSKLIEGGFTPRITCAATNNGLDGTYQNAPTEKGDVLTIDSATIGYVSYQCRDFIATDHVEKLISKDGSRIGYHCGLFIKTMIDNAVSGKYGYGYKFSQTRIKKQTIILPVTETEQPDWQFMEEYMKQVERQLLKPTINKLCKRLITNELLGGGKSLHSNWKEFVFGDEFSIESTQSGIDKNKLIKEQGNIPYVTRSDVTNGIDMFICEQSSKYKVDEGNVITIGLDTQTVFYQPSSFYTGQNIQVIRHKELDRYNAQFLIVAIKKLVNKFSWGSYGATLTRLRKSKIYLPVDSNGNIDFQFMSSFMKQIETDILSTTLSTFKNRLKNNRLNINKLGGVIWSEFYIRDLFPRMEVGKSKGLNHLEKDDFGISYLGATNLNNGVLCFVKAVDNLVQKGNCIAFIRNGEGSMGYSVYKAEDFIATSDMTLAYSEHINKYTGMFITTIADRIRGKYNFGYKRSATRLAKEVLSLPVTPAGHPDWEFMEQYMRNIESDQILKYLSSISSRTAFNHQY